MSYNFFLFLSVVNLSTGTLHSDSSSGIRPFFFLPSPSSSDTGICLKTVLLRTYGVTYPTEYVNTLKILVL